MYYGIVDLIPTSLTKLYQAVNKNDTEDIKVANRKNNDRMGTATDIDPERTKEFVEEIMQEVVRIKGFLGDGCKVVAL